MASGDVRLNTTGLALHFVFQETPWQEFVRPPGPLGAGGR